VGNWQQSSYDRVAAAQLDLNALTQDVLSNSFILGDASLHYDNESVSQAYGVPQNKSFTTTISGIEKPFPWNGAAFRVVRVNFNLESAADVRLTIKDENRNILQTVSKHIGSDLNGWHMFILKSTVAAGAAGILYLGISAGGKSRLIPNGADFDESGGVDYSIHNSYLTTTTGGFTWIEFTETVDETFDMAFELIPETAFSLVYDQLNDKLSKFLAGESFISYGVPDASETDLVYTSAAGAAVRLPVQSSEIVFNYVKLRGGMSGAGTVRGYVLDPGFPNTHVPSVQGDLLFSVPVTDWDNVVRERVVDLPATYTLPAEKELHVLFSADASSNVRIGRYSTKLYLMQALLQRQSLKLPRYSSTLFWVTWYHAKLGS